MDVAIEDGDGNTLVKTTTEKMAELPRATGEFWDGYQRWKGIQERKEECSRDEKELMAELKSRGIAEDTGLAKRAFRERRRYEADRDTWAEDQAQLELHLDQLGLGD